MRFIGRIVAGFIANAFALIVIAKFLPQVTIPNDFSRLFILTLILTALNLFLKPILRVILSPVIILTLGLGMIFVNAAILFTLDFLSEDITIHGIQTYLYAGIILGIVNFFAHLLFR